MKYFLDPKYGESVKLSNNYLTVTSIFNKWVGICSNLPINITSKNKIYFECYIESVNANNTGITLITKSQSLDYHNGYYYWSDGTDNNQSWNIGDTISVLYDRTINNGTLTFFINGEPKSLKYTNLNNEILYLGIIVYDGDKHQKVSVNFGSTPFKYKQPNNYRPLDDNNKYLVKQNSKYYSLKSSFYELGQPQDNNEKERFYKENGIDDLNILVEKKNSRSLNLKLDKNDIYKTVIPINFNEITNKIEYIDEDNKKEIKYNTEEYQLLDLIKKKIGSKFQIAKWEEK